MNDSTAPYYESSPFHQLVPDCRKLIFSFHWHRIAVRDIPHRRAFHISTPETASNLQFALQYFKCEASLNSLSELDVPLLSELYSFCMMAPSKNAFSNLPRPFSHFNKLVELNIYDNGAFRDEIFQDLESLEVLAITGKYKSQQITDRIFQYLKNLRSLDLGTCYAFTDDMFKHLKQLKHLKIESCGNFTDAAIENLYHAGSRLDKLEIHICSGITKYAFSHIEGYPLRELILNNCLCWRGQGLRYLSGVDRMTLCGMNHMDCREAFKCMDGSAQYLSISDSCITYFDEKAVGFLKGIHTLILDRVIVENVPNATLSHLSGSIKRMEIRLNTGSEGMSKDMLWHLSGIEQVSLCYTGISIEAEDTPRLQQIFKNVSSCEVSSDFADDATMKQLREFIVERGGNFVVREV